MLWKVVNCLFFGNLRACYRLGKYAHKADYRDEPLSPTTTVRMCDVTHAVVIPFYNEPIDKLRETLDTLKSQGGGMPQQMIVVLATEERDLTGILAAKLLHREYGPFFREVLCTSHRLAEGEVAGKGSNENWAVRCLKHHLVDDQHVNIGQVVITVCDADTFFPAGFSSELAWRFCSSEGRRHLTIWQAPIYCVANMPEIKNLLCKVRYTILSVTTTAAYYVPWASCRPDTDTLPLSCYSVSLALMQRAAYWDPAVITEDANMWMRCTLATAGAVHVEIVDKVIAMDSPPVFCRRCIPRAQL